MTLQELYTLISGNYEQAQRIMKMDKLIDRYIRKLKDSGLDQKLAEAGETMDPKQLFDTAHAMKGVCANLGLDELANAADEISEEFRPGNPRTLSDEEVKAKLQNISNLYQKTLEGIDQYLNG